MVFKRDTTALSRNSEEFGQHCRVLSRIMWISWVCAAGSPFPEMLTGFWEAVRILLVLSELIHLVWNFDEIFPLSSAYAHITATPSIQTTSPKNLISEREIQVSSCTSTHVSEQNDATPLQIAALFNGSAASFTEDHSFWKRGVC